MSAGSPQRRSGMRRRYSGPPIGSSISTFDRRVLMIPGLTALMRMPCWPRSRLAARTNPTSPALEVEYGAVCASG